MGWVGLPETGAREQRKGRDRRPRATVGRAASAKALGRERARTDKGQQGGPPAELCSVACMDHVVFARRSTDGRLGRVHLWPLVKNAPVNTACSRASFFNRREENVPALDLGCHTGEAETLGTAHWTALDEHYGSCKRYAT